jgi:hypothetical protein
MSNAKRTVDINKRKRTEGEDPATVVYVASIVLDAPTEEEPVTLADVQELLADAATENSIPSTAKVTTGTRLDLQWTDADLPP